MFIAHKTESKDHLLLAHLLGVAKKSALFCDSFNMKELGYLIGYLHDIGKYSEDFQARIKGLNIKVDHSTAGAIELTKLLEQTVNLLGMIIAGHHSGLQDLGLNSDIENGSYKSRLKSTLKDYSKFLTEIDLKALNLDDKSFKDKLQNTFLALDKKMDNNKLGFSLGFIIRMIYSSVVDSDFLDTESFYIDSERGQYLLMKELLEKYNYYIKSFTTDKKTNANLLIYEQRNKILKKCIASAISNRNLFTLMVPTGSGKTLSSLGFALNHAVENKMDKIIYVIPYTSIIEQTAKEFKKIFGELNVLEHHSNFTYEAVINNDNKEDNKKTLYEYASENWDIPVIVTTNVQFFESFFANKSSKVRKLHNVSNSVIIFDEIQQLPIDYLNPCISVLSELILNYNSSVVLCSATHPKLENYFYNKIKDKHVKIIENTDEIYAYFNKVNLTYLGDVDDNIICDNLNKCKNALCIVNTRKHAKAIFEKIKGIGVYHLSTLLTPFDRKLKIIQIRKALENKERCIVVSTQLIEAGVDLDFDVVYRSVTGIDSIAQAAGRCNREGKLEKGEVYVFQPISDNAKLIGDLKNNAAMGKSILTNYGNNSLTLEAIELYFDIKYSSKFEENNLDKKQILENFYMGKNNTNILNFKKVANDFKLIESNTFEIIIQNEHTEALIKKIKNGHPSKSINREIQQHTVSIYEYEFKNLEKLKIFDIFDNYIFLNNNSFYDCELGLKVFEDNNSNAYFL